MTSFSKAFREKSGLSGLGRKLLRSRSITATAPPREWTDELASIQRYRSFRNKAAGWNTALFIICLLVIVFTLVIAELIITIVALVGLLLSLVLFARLKKVSFPAGAADLLLPIAATLKEDMKPGAMLEITLDLSGPVTSRKKKTTRKVPDSELAGRVRSRKDTFFEDPWLVIRGKLIDQTAFQILCQNDVRESRSVKRSASGKTKHKTKYKSKCRQLVTLKPGATATAVNPPPIGAAHQTVIKERDNGFSVVATNQSTVPSKPVACNAEADLLLDLFAAAAARYQ